MTELERRGYVIGCVSDLILEEPYEIDHTGRQFKGSVIGSVVESSEAMRGESSGGE